MTDSTCPRLCFLGSLVGRNPGSVTTQGQIVADLFQAADWPVISASSAPRRLDRLADISLTLVRHRRQIDVVCAEVYGGRSFVVETIIAWLCRAFRLPLVMVLHGGDLPRFMRRFPRWSRHVLRRASALVAPSPYLVEFAESFGFAAQHIPNVIDLPKYPYRRRTHVAPRLLWMRSFHPIYNPTLALRALTLACAMRPDLPGVRLVMAGMDKGWLGETARAADALAVSDLVEFPGFLDTAGKVAHFGAADIFLNTSRIDNMPVSVIEAGAMGLPIISTAVGGIPYLLRDGESGLLVPDDDAPALAAAILRLFEEPALAGRLSRNGRALAEQSAWERVYPQWESLFKSLSFQGQSDVRHLRQSERHG